MGGYRTFWIAGGVTAALLAAGVWHSLASRPSVPEQVYTPPATEQPITPIPDSLALDARKVELGRRLFHDKRLSLDDSISCASCHDLKLAGMDGRPVGVGVANQMGMVNSPTVLNSVFNFRQFWDGRAATLEEQVEGPLHNPIEMATNWKMVIEKLSRDPYYPGAFQAIWPDGIQAVHIQSAIAEFERSLITPDSPFDRYLKGDQQALSAQARKGWDLFRNLGILGDYFADRGRPLVKADLGRFNITGREEDRHMFKVPSLRNVARTAPYFHDGSIDTLEKAVDTMARYQLGQELGAADRQALVAFLQSLNGRLPKIEP